MSCVECKASHSCIINSKEGTIVCQTCGLVQMSRIIDDTLETRNFSKDATSRGGDDNKRCGGANVDLLSDRGIMTLISGGPDTGLSRWAQRSAQSGADKQLVRGFQAIGELTNNLHLNDVCADEAKLIFKSITEQRGLKGRSYQAMVAACVFIASRKSNPRSIREISKITNVDQKEILRCYSMMKKLIPTGVVGNHSAAYYAKRFANELNFSTAHVKAAENIAVKSIELEILTGKSPLSIASAAVYLVGQLFGIDKSSLSDISEVSTMKDITIKNCVKAMSQRLHELIRGFDTQIDPKKVIQMTRQPEIENNFLK